MILNLLPPSFKRTVSHYQYGKAYLIKRYVESFDWNRTLENFCPNE